MKIVVDTQFRENYGAHDWNGTGECPQYWKCKGGSTYVLHGVSVEDAMGSEVWEELRAAVESYSEYSEEYIIGSTLVDEVDYVESDFVESWDSVTNLTRVDGVFYARKVTTNDFLANGIVRSIRTYAISEGSTVDSLLSYEFEDGTVRPYAEACEFIAAQKEAA